jgi:hypothetical protein
MILGGGGTGSELSTIVPLMFGFSSGDDLVTVFATYLKR